MKMPPVYPAAGRRKRRMCVIAVQIICVGKLKEAYWRAACAEYGKRLGAFCRFTIEEVEESRLPDKPSQAQIAVALEKEGQRLLQRAQEAQIIALCIEGKELSSTALSEYMQREAVNGCGKLAFIIGGSWGLSQQVKQAAALRLSMSPMTFPHQLARVMLCEQVYRAFQIASNGKYHK